MQITHVIILTVSMNPVLKREKKSLRLAAPLAQSHAQSSAAKIFVVSVGMNGQIGEHIRHHIWSAAWQSRDALKLEELSEHGQP